MVFPGTQVRDPLMNVIAAHRTVALLEALRPEFGTTRAPGADQKHAAMAARLLTSGLLRSSRGSRHDKGTCS